MDQATKRIMDYLEEVAKQDNCLASKLADKSVKTYDKMMTYITREAKKLCEKGSSSVCVDDDTVFKWARHYWLDYEEKVETKKTAKETETDDEENSLFDDEQEQPKVKKVKVVQSKEKDPQEYEQMSLFDF